MRSYDLISANQGFSGSERSDPLCAIFRDDYKKIIEISISLSSDQETVAR